MKKFVFGLAALVALVAQAEVSVKAVITAVDRRTTREVTLPVVKTADGAWRATLAKEDALDAWRVEFYPSCAVARKGEDGFWMANRGQAGFFTRDSGAWTTSWNWLALPCFGMQTPRGSFLAVIEGMRFEAEIRVGVKEGVYSMYTRWHTGETGFGSYEDMSLLVYELPKGSDYNEMAKAYRRYKFATDPDMKTLKERIKERPHVAQLAKCVAVRQICAAKDIDFKKDDIDFTPETERPVKVVKSFDDTLKTLQKMKAMGLDDVAMCLAGWQGGGYDGRAPAAFPVEPIAGGEAGLKRLLKGGRDLGYIMDAQDNYTDCYTVSPLWDGGDVACLGVDGKLDINGIWNGGRAYNLCLKNAWDVKGFMKENLARSAEVGFWGSHYIDVFSAVYPYSCLNPRHKANRTEQMKVQVEVAKFCIEKFGGFSSECCFDHMLAYTDYINYAKAYMRDWRRAKAAGKDSLADTMVPFFELAFHDCVLSNPDKITQEVLAQPENLVLVEFGGRPIFYHIGEDNLAGIKAAYEQFKPLRHLQLEEMVEHRILEKGPTFGDGTSFGKVFVRVTYGNGDRLYVNHGLTEKTADGITVPAQSFKLVTRK